MRPATPALIAASGARRARRFRWPRATGLALLLGALGAPWLRAREPPPQAGGGAWVGSGVCARCHAREATEWAASMHARSVGAAGPATLPAGALGARVEHAPGWTRLGATDGGVTATTPGPDGEPADYALTHAVGGRRLTMFLATLEDGRLQVLPGLYEVPAQRWFDYTWLLFGAPGADPRARPEVRPGEPSFWTGPVRSFEARCAGCHTSGYRPRLPDAASGTRGSWRALGVDCESCHGPGRAHADAWAALDPGHPLERIERLPKERADRICLACHLEGERRGDPFAGPADLFEAIDPTLLLDPERVDPLGRPLELIYEGLSFTVSRCATRGGLRCVDCHAAHGGGHGVDLRASPAQENERLCGRCHTAEVRDARAHSRHAPSGPAGRCTACHMPRLEVERGHGRVTDHALTSPWLAAPGDRLAQSACLTCHQGPDAPPRSPAELEAAWATWWPASRGPPPEFEALGRARAGDVAAAPLLAALLADAAAGRIQRASALRLLARLEPLSAAEAARHADDPDALVRRHLVEALAEEPGRLAREPARVTRALQDPSPLVRAAIARSLARDWALLARHPAWHRPVREVLEAECRAVPNDDARWHALGVVCQLAGDLDAAIEAFGHKLRLDSLDPGLAAHVERLKAARGR